MAIQPYRYGLKTVNYLLDHPIIAIVSKDTRPILSHLDFITPQTGTNMGSQNERSIVYLRYLPPRK